MVDCIIYRRATGSGADDHNDMAVLQLMVKQHAPTRQAPPRRKCSTAPTWQAVTAFRPCPAALHLLHAIGTHRHQAAARVAYTHAARQIKHNVAARRDATAFLAQVHGVHVAPRLATARARHIHLFPALACAQLMP